MPPHDTHPLTFPNHTHLPFVITSQGLKPSRIAQVLVVLISQNCVVPVQCELPQHDASHVVSYKIDVDQILHRLRYPRFLLHTKECMGPVHESLLEGLLERGRARASELFESSQISQTATARKTKPKRNALEDAFEDLVDGRFIERVPFGWDVGDDFLLQENGEDQDLEFHGNERRTAGHSNQNKTSSSNPRDNLFGDEHLWRVNSDEFNRRFRHVACAALVREKIDDAAGHLLLVMLELTRAHEQSVNEERSTPVGEREIVIHVGRNPGVFKFTPELINTTLEKMVTDTSELISRIDDHAGGGNGTQYCVNMRRIIDLIRMKEIEAVVRERFGGPACRVFRLLIMKRNLEQKQIAEMAMIPVKDTRELLYKLLKAEYVMIQEVARTSDHAPSRTFYLWRVDLLRVVEQVGRELYRATSNLRARLIHELVAERETLSVLADKTKDVTNLNLTETQKQNLRRVKRSATALESSLLRLDELVCFFAVW